MRIGNGDISGSGRARRAGGVSPSPACSGCRSLGGQRGGADEARRVLAGAIDIHVHSDPDNVPRSVDGLEAAKLARAKGMRGIVLKNHYDPTGGLAYLARKAAPGLEVFGGIDLNLPVGGMNPAAVEHMTKVAGGWGRVVWMSTFDAENQVRFSKANRPFVSVSRDGRAAAGNEGGHLGHREASARARHRARVGAGGPDAAPRGTPTGRGAHGRHPRDERARR